MFIIEYIVLALITLFEVFCMVKYLIQNKFEHTDIYVTQFLIAGAILYILSNIILFSTWNIPQNKIYVTSITRAIYIVVYCTSIPFISSYIFNHISISKQIDVTAHLFLGIAHMIPVVMIIMIPFYLNGKYGVPTRSLFEVLSTPDFLSKIEENRFMNAYMFIIEFDSKEPYFSTALSFSWLSILTSYIIIIVSVVLRKLKIKAKRIEHYYLFLLMLLYIGLTLNLLCSPHEVFTVIIYHLRQAIEIVFYIVILKIGRVKKRGKTHGIN